MKFFCFLLTAVLTLSGCQALPRAREMGDMALLRTLGVDLQEGGFAITASTGSQAQGQRGQEEAAQNLTAGGGSVSAACLALQSQGDRYVFFGYVDQLLMGEELARQDVTTTLDYLTRDTELGLGVRLWVVLGDTAAAAMESGGEKGVDSRLEALHLDGEQGVTICSRTAEEVYADLLELGAAYVPALTVTAEGVRPAGYAVLKDNAVVGVLAGETLRGLELLTGRPERDVLETSVGGEPVVLEVTEGSARCRWNGEVVQVSCRVEARLTEQRNAPDGETLELLEEWLSARERARIEAALTQLQTWNTDCAGVMVRAALTDPAAWKTGAQREFARTEIEVGVTARVRP